MIKGKLEPFAETGTEGVIWSLEDNQGRGYDSLHCLDYGDFLRVFDPEDENKVIWEGRIDFEWERRYRTYPLNPQYGQQEIFGVWVHGFQFDVEPEDWGTWFFKNYPAEYEPCNLGRFHRVKSSSIRAYSWNGVWGYYKDEPKPGDLVIKFVNGAFYRFKDVPAEILKEFVDAESKGKFFYKNIKNKFEVEKINL